MTEFVVHILVKGDLHYIAWAWDHKNLKSFMVQSMKDD